MSERHPSTEMTFMVCLVTKGNDDWTYPALEEVCRHLGVEYMQRAYDSRTYSADREYIERLPAFHVFEFGHRTGTYYPGPDILGLEKMVYMYRKKEAKRKQSVWTWIFGGRRSGSKRRNLVMT